MAGEAGAVTEAGAVDGIGSAAALMRATSLVSTWPGPTSTKAKSPWPTSLRTVSVQRTGEAICAARRSFRLSAV